MLGSIDIHVTFTGLSKSHMNGLSIDALVWQTMNFIVGHIIPDHLGLDAIACHVIDNIRACRLHSPHSNSRLCFHFNEVDHNQTAVPSNNPMPWAVLGNKFASADWFCHCLTWFQVCCLLPGMVV